MRARAPLLTFGSQPFQRRLRELGWVDGRNVAIEFRWAEGQFDRLANFGDEFVRRGVDIIVAEGRHVIHSASAMPRKQTRRQKIGTGLQAQGAAVEGLAVRATHC